MAGGFEIGGGGQTGVDSGIENFQNQADNATAINEAQRESYSTVMAEQRETDTHVAAEDQATNNNKRIANAISQNSRG